MKLESMSSFVHIDKTSSILHAQTHPRSDESLQALTAQAINDPQRLHMCAQLYTVVHFSISDVNT